VDPLLAAALFRAIKPSYSCTLIWGLLAVEFPCGHGVFAEGNPVTGPSSLFRHYSGKVNIGHCATETVALRSPVPSDDWRFAWARCGLGHPE
jgi:hypothetical protein